MVGRLPRLVPSSLLDGRQGEEPREMVAVALARSMRRQYVWAEQGTRLPTEIQDAAKVVDRLSSVLADTLPLC